MHVPSILILHILASHSRSVFTWIRKYITWNLLDLGKETIKSDIGKIKCIKLRPKMVVDRVFKSENAMTIWISDDLNRIPVRVKSEIAVGSLKVDLTSYKNLRNPFSAKL